ncbi:MAG: oligosaccharide flippase family protein [Rhizobiales bacterium]|nr:oligosaccharide flippase family protein [Hyphomicrobiales bacterium]
MAVARNVIANTVGTAVLAAATAATTIFSFRLAGAEQFGLIGFYLTLHGIVAILDTGIGPGIVREVAHARSGGHEYGLGSILFTFQGIYAGITGLTTIVLIAASSFIAHTWLTARTISAGDIQIALILSALIIASQPQRTVYSVFLEGLEQQVLVNILQSSFAVLRALVVLAALLLVAPTALVFLAAFLAISIAELAVTAWYAWAAVEDGDKARFLTAMVRRLWAFLLTSSLAVAVGALLQSVDKIIVSAMLPLDVVGRYMFVSQICLLVLKLIAPNVTAIFPRLSASIRRADIVEARRVYFAAAQIVSCIVAVFGLGAVFFGGDALLLLTGDARAAQDYHWLFALLAFAFGLNGFCLIPNALRLSEGQPGTALWANAIAGVVYLPAIWLLTPSYGVIVPAALWFAVNAFVFVVLVARAHRDALAGYAWPWLATCVAPQLAASAAVYSIAKFLLPQNGPPMLAVSVAVVAAGVGFIAAVAASSDMRHSVASFIRRAYSSRAALAR